eukprot:CAMPEP_0197826598 /NCGR_PEP_ID=MMETSP1437-20131217/3541_1 /TAXON_ID=49252 ORGANISM="Eucampia antarctica, Strain CCMP1452" /NCGR_SAMPLE_ID=MMETSP1437 /ASSEMBLY_ACC=CAM_ASM_001096 /LENGTH=147 /DNA_ID=CAMNT_0043427105 /DNA_START=187 /DNA_END=630 /DNA_ORIENTATION=-
MATVRGFTPRITTSKRTESSFSLPSFVNPIDDHHRRRHQLGSSSSTHTALLQQQDEETERDSFQVSEKKSNDDDDSGGGGGSNSLLDQLNDFLDTPILDANNKSDQGPMAEALKNFVRDESELAQITFSVAVVSIIFLILRLYLTLS